MTMEDTAAIRDLNYSYALHADTMEMERWVGVFAPDGILDEREFELGLHVGHDGLRAYGRKMREQVVHQVHLMTNHLITEVAPDAATGTVFALVEAITHAIGRVRFHVRYDDEYVRLDGQWKIKSRVLRKTFPPEIIAAPSSAG